MSEKPKVFISYAKKDQESVKKIVDFLKKHDCKPWLDEDVLLPGQNWKQVIKSAIRDNDQCIVCLSKNYIKSREGFRWEELRDVLDRSRKMPFDKIYLIPVRLEICDVPDPLEEIHWCDWFAPNGKEKLLQSLGIQKDTRKRSTSAKEKQPTPPQIITPQQMEEITVPLPGLSSSAKPLIMVRIPAGKFMMGSPEGEKDRDNDEGPQHLVKIPHDFFMGKYPITQAQWEAVMNGNPSYFEGNPNHPVEQVSWNDCQKFIQKLNQLEEGVFRLPSEAEWEYACRAGTKTRFYWGDDLNDDCAWNRKNSDGKTHEVGLKQSNAWGLHDMSGNVWEWCEDHWHENYKDAPKDGQEWTINDDDSSASRVVRGGSWYYYPLFCRSACRALASPVGRLNDLGFRVVQSRTP